MMGRKQAATSAPMLPRVKIDSEGGLVPLAPVEEMTSGGAVADTLQSDLGAAGASFVGHSSLSAYLRQLRHHPLLSREEEHALAVRYGATGERAAGQRLVTANLRLVVKIAQEYRRIHRNLID